MGEAAEGSPRDRATAPRIALALVLAGVLVALVTGDKPWDPEIRARFAEDRAELDDWVATWIWWMLAIAAAVLAGLLATVRRWIGGPVPPAPGPPPRRAHPLAIVLVLLAMATSATLGWTRLDQSFWGDEAYSARHAIVGHYRMKDDAPDFRRAKWKEVLWFYDGKPNNHVFASALAHLSFRAYTKLVGPQPRTDVEASVRLPAYVAGLAAIPMLAVVVRSCGFPWAAVLAAWLLALNPWHLRYATEARGYALLFLLVPLFVWLLDRALRTPTWRRWLAVGASEVGILWTFAGALPFVLVPNLVALGVLAYRHGLGRGAADPWWRMAVTTALAAVTWLVVMGPNVPRLLAFVFPGEDGSQLFVARLKWSFLRDVGTHLLVGTHWGDPSPSPVRPELADLAATAPWAAWLFVGVAALALVAGCAALLRASPLGRLVVAAGVAAPVLFFLAARANETMLYIWYLSPALPLVVGIAAVGIEAPARRLAGASARPVFAAVALLLLAGYAIVSAPERVALRARSLQPLRESVLLARGTLDPEDPAFFANEVIGAYEREPFYDPLLTKVTTTEGLDEVITRARAEGRGVRVIYGRPRLFEKRLPELYAALQDPERFERIADMKGYGPRHHRVVLALREDSATRPGAR